VGLDLLAVMSGAIIYSVVCTIIWWWHGLHG
jgi:hypothetical protein